MQEELRTRLWTMRQALQRTSIEDEYIHIQNAFTNRDFKAFINMVDVCQAIDSPIQLHNILVERLKVGKGQLLRSCIDKYGIYFIEEFKHFLRMHGFSKIPEQEPAKRMI